LLTGQIMDALAANEKVTGGGQFQTCYHAQHGSLSTATRPQQGHQLALFHGKGDVIDGGSFAEAFCDLFQFDAHPPSTLPTINLSARACFHSSKVLMARVNNASKVNKLAMANAAGALYSL